MTDAALAALVNAAARTAPAAARFRGGRKVFVAELPALLRRAGYHADLDVLKGRLVELNRQGLVVLARFDLPSLHDAQVVSQSEMASGLARWHCVEDPSMAF